MDGGYSLLPVIPTVFVGLYMCIFLHEMGHLAAIVIVDWKPLEFRVGSGSRITIARIGDLHFQLGATPLGGLVRSAAKTPAGFRWKWFLTALAGPVVTLIVVWALGELLASPRLELDLPAWAISSMSLLFFSQVVLLLSCLAPHTFRMDGEEIWNDGRQMVDSLNLPDAKVAQQAYLHCVVEANILLERNQEERALAAISEAVPPPGNTLLEVRMVWIDRLLKLGRIDAANAAIDGTLKELEKLGASRGTALDSLACLPLFFGHGQMSERAMTYIETAIALEPEVITYKGTKGALLAEAGKTEAAVGLLSEVLCRTESDNDRAICSYYLALAQRKLGNSQEARRMLEEAMVKYPHCIVRPRVLALFNAV